MPWIALSSEIAEAGLPVHFALSDVQVLMDSPRTGGLTM